jgi:hypothetical protein
VEYSAVQCGVMVSDPWYLISIYTLIIFPGHLAFLKIKYAQLFVSATQESYAFW